MEPNYCNTTLDCVIDGVVKECFEQASFSDDIFFCDCSVWFGWKGLDCDEVSFGLLLNRYSIIFLIIYASILVVLTGRSVILNYLMNFNPIQGIDPIIFAGFFLFVSSLFFLISLSLALPAFLFPDQFRVYKEKTIFIEAKNEVASHFGETSKIFIQLISFFLTISTFFVLLSWEKLFIKLKRFMSPEEVEIEKQLRVVLIILYFICLFITLVLLSARYLIASVAFLVVLASGASIILIVFSIKFVRTVKSITTFENNQVKDTVRLVKKTCILASICTVAIAFCSILYIILNNVIQERNAPGDLNYVLLSQHISLFFSLVYTTILAWYINSVTEGAILADTCPCLCFIFRIWDKENKRLMPDDDVIMSEKRDVKLKS